MSADPPSSQRHLAAVWFADIVGYSTLAARDEPAALRHVERLQALAREAAAESGGRIVKGIGDAVLAEFTSTEAAVRAALGLRARYARETAGTITGPLRIGVHVGDVVAAPDGDVYGDGVNVAARLQHECAPGEVLVSGDVWRQLRQRPEYRFTARGERTLRGQDEATQVFVVDEAGAVDASAAALSTAVPSAEPVPAGAKPSAVRRRPKLSHRIARPRTALALGAMIVLAILAAWLARRSGGLAGGSREPATLAVLPFENLSGDPTNEPFVAGVHDDLLTSLSATGTFRVVSRTSVMGYRGSDKSLSDIGRELGADVVLEGGVQRAGDRIRMNVQLINAKTDQHLWAERYDRTLSPENVFAIQGDIAERIAAALQTVLSPGERAAIARAPTADLEALDLYYRGKELYRQRASATNARDAVRTLEAAVAEDPDFGAAWAALARAQAWLVRLSIETDLASARQALDRARALAPDALETSLAEGDFLYYAEADFRGAAEHFAAALERWPEDAEIRGALAIVLRRLGRWEESVAHHQRALEQDPRNAFLLSNLGGTYWMLHDYDAADELFDRTLELVPDNELALYHKFLILLMGRGDLAGARRYLAANAQRFEAALYAQAAGDLAYLARDFERGLASVEGAPRSADSPQYAFFLLAVLAHGAGRDAEARAWADSVRVVAERNIERARAAANDPFGLEAKSLTWRGTAYALLGRRQEATRDAERAVELMPVSRDAVEGAEVLDGVQMIHSLTANRDAAFRALDQFYLGTAAPRAGSGRLRLEPTYDSLRGDRRFDALIRKVEELERRGGS